MLELVRGILKWENAPFILTHPDVQTDIENRLNALQRAFKLNT